PPKLPLFPYTTLFRSEKSLLIQVVRQTHADIKMPPKEKLAADQVEALVAWIKDGAPWVEAAASSTSGRLGDAWSDSRNPIVRILDRKSTRLNSSHSQI